MAGRFSLGVVGGVLFRLLSGYIEGEVGLRAGGLLIFASHHIMVVPTVRAPLAISAQAVQEVLHASRDGALPASVLAARFNAVDDAARLRLVQALSAVADVVPVPSGESIVRLKSKSASNNHGYHTPRSSGPLPIDAVAVRALLLAQPRQEMLAADLKERFAASSDAERQALVVAISQVAELVGTPNSGPMVRLLPTEQRPALSTAVDAGSSVSSASRGGANSHHQPITPIERDLVRKVLAASPRASMRPADLVRLLAPDDPAAKRRLARVLSEVATVTSHPDGSAYLVLRDSTNRPSSDDTESVASSVDRHVTGGGGRRRVRQPGFGGSSHMSPSTLSEASTRSVGLPCAPSWAASGHAPPVAQIPEDAADDTPTVVTEALVVDLLRAKGGRMPSIVLISRLQPLDRTGQRALALVVQRVCETQLPEGASNSGATIVLKESLIRDRLEARCASVIQHALRTRHEALMASVGAAVDVQAAARRMLARGEAQWHRTRRDAANMLQQAAVRRGYVRELHRARCELRAAITLQMAARRWRFHRNTARRAVGREYAAASVQAARRGQLARRSVALIARELMISKETPEETAAREERERTAMLRDKLRRRKRNEKAEAERAAAPRRPQPLVAVDEATAADAAAPSSLPAPPPPADNVQLVEDDADGVMRAMLSRMALTEGGVDETDIGGSVGGLGASVGLGAAGDDFLAAMRAMMAQHGGEDDVDDE